ncbi:MAG TPA: trehalose-phosphatase [Polyangia bacterium]
MTYLFSRASLGILAGFLERRVLLAFDFDGTLAPIVSNPDGARMRGTTRRLLGRLCDLYPCAVISGRRRADVMARLDGLAIRHVIGNHGVEAARSSIAPPFDVARTTRILEAALRHVAGLQVEDKTHSLAIHYRRATDRGRARREIERVLGSLPPALRILRGNLVYDLLAPDAPHKGDALARLRREADVDTAIYVGDDVTDEDVFRLPHDERLLPVRVGQTRASAARYFVRDQSELDSLLAYALRARTPGRRQTP